MQTLVAILIASSCCLTVLSVAVFKIPPATRDAFKVAWPGSTPTDPLQLGSTAHLGSWRWPPDGDRCVRPLKPAFYPYDEAADRVWTAPLLSFYAAAAGSSSLSAETALECANELGVPRRLIDEHKKLRIALLGDSVDRVLVEEYCTLIGAPIHCHAYNACECNSKLLHIRSHWITGSDLDGLGPDAQSHPGPVLAGIEKFLSDDPWEWDSIMLNSMQWDMLRLHVNTPQVLDHVTLPNDFIAGWMHNVTLMMQKVKEVAPNAKTQWRTVAAVEGFCEHVSPLEENHWWSRPWINNHLAAMNDAGRVVAAANGFMVHDLDMMTRQLNREARLRDANHPLPPLQMEVLNRILISYFLS